MTVLLRERDRRDDDHQPLEPSLDDTLPGLANPRVDVRDGRSLPVKGVVRGGEGGVCHGSRIVRVQGIHLQSREILRRLVDGGLVGEGLVVRVRGSEGVGGTGEVK